MTLFPVLCTFLVGFAQSPVKAEPKFALTTDEKEMLRLINEARAEEKLPALKPDPVLTRGSDEPAALDELRRRLDATP